MLRAPLLIFLALQSQPALAEDLLLICQGSMRGMFKDRSVSGGATSSEGATVSGGASSSGYRDVPTTAIFELRDGKAKLNLPQPPTCAICEGEKGWRDVRELVVDEDRISGKIKYGFLSGTEFEIDRRTGIMTSKNGFQGLCEPQDVTVRKF